MAAPSLTAAALVPFSLLHRLLGPLGFGETWTRPWPGRMPPCPPQQSRNRVTQLPTPELGEMELTWQEIMSITELQVSRDVNKGEAGRHGWEGTGLRAGDVAGPGKGGAGVGGRWRMKTVRNLEKRRCG